MTELIGTHEIPCLSDTDYAAYALYMKCLAEQVEDQLVTNLAAVESVLHRPVRVWSDSSSQSQGSGTTRTPDGVQFSHNYPANFTDIQMSTLNLRGWWRIGLLFRCTSNTPVVGNNRTISLSIFPPNTPSSLRNQTDNAWALRLQDITWETNTGSGESLYTSGEVYNPGDPTVTLGDFGMRMLLNSTVENSGVETVTFTGIIWAVYLGDTPSIEI